jgi:hypothetical protein
MEMAGSSCKSKAISSQEAMNNKTIVPTQSRLVKLDGRSQSLKEHVKGNDTQEERAKPTPLQGPLGNGLF